MAGFMGKWVFCGGNACDIVHVHVIELSKCDNALDRHPDLALFVVRVCCLCDVYDISYLGLIKIMVLPQGSDYLIILHLDISWL